jgi:hypothetical protein
MKQWKITLIIAVCAFACGKFLSPPKTVEKIVYRESTSQESDTSHTTKKKEIIKPDGTKITETTTKSDKKTKKTSDISLDKQKTVENRPDWHVNVVYWPSIQSYSVDIQRRILSEIYIGVSASQDRKFGVSIGVGF